MKTVPAPAFEYSVYPLQTKTKNTEENSFSVSGKLVNMKKADLPPVAPEAFDRPENWDVYWFASYE